MPYNKILPVILVQVLFSLFFYSCEFETDKVYERKVDKDADPPEITVVDLDLESDTIFLFNGRNIAFLFTSSNQKINIVRFNVDGNEAAIYSSGEGIFLLDYGNINEGEHTLVLEVITGSGTNSIADILGAEGYVFSKTWVLNVYKDYNTKLDTRVKNGCLNFSWEKYPVPDFKEYIIYREKSYYEKIEVGRTTSVEFTDCSYVGEGGRYFVEVLKKDGQLFSWGYVELYQELPVLSFIGTFDNEYTIKWSKSKYYNAVDIFQLSANTGYGWNFINVKETRNPQDTSWNISSSLLFGDNIDLKLLLIPKNSVIYTSDENYRFESVLYEVELGFRFKAGLVNAYHITQVSADEFIYILNCDSLVRYSVSQKRAVEKLTYAPSHCSMCKFLNFKVSPSGKYLTTRVDCEYDLMLANIQDLQDNKRYNLQSYSGQYSISDVPVSDKGTGIVTGTASGFYVYDFNTSSSLGYYNKEIYGGTGLSISSDGNYIFLKDDLFRLVSFANAQFTSIWNYPGSDIPKYYEFHGTDPERLVIWNGSLFSVRKCSDFTEYYNFSLTDNSILSVDYFRNELLTYSDGHLFVRSLTDGSLIKDIPVNIDPTNWFYACILVNHAVICTTGVIYFIN
jgi:hypothetical protein